MKKSVLIAVTLISFVFAGSVYAESSAKNRGDNWMMVGLSPLGASVQTLLAQPLTVAFLLGERLMVGAEAGQASDSKFGNSYSNNKFDSSNAEESETNVRGTYIDSGAYVRFFLVDSSFNFRLAQNKRTWVGTGELKKSSGTAKADMEFTALVSSIGFGNQWLFDKGFVIGFDYYVNSRLTNSSVNYTILSNTGIPQNELETEIEEFGEFLNNVSALPSVAVLTIGFVF